MNDKTTIPEDEQSVALDLYPAEFILEPLVGLTIQGTDNRAIWLSWEETQKLSEFMRRHVAA